MDDQFRVQAYSHRVQAANTLYGTGMSVEHRIQAHQGPTGTLAITDICNCHISLV